MIYLLVDRFLNVKIADLELGTLPAITRDSFDEQSSDILNRQALKEVTMNSTTNPLSKVIKSESPTPSVVTSRFSLTSKHGVDDDVESVLSSIDLESRGSIAHHGEITRLVTSHLPRATCLEPLALSHLS